MLIVFSQNKKKMEKIKLKLKLNFPQRKEEDNERLKRRALQCKKILEDAKKKKESK